MNPTLFPKKDGKTNFKANFIGQFKFANCLGDKSKFKNVSHRAFTKAEAEEFFHSKYLIDGPLDVRGGRALECEFCGIIGSDVAEQEDGQVLHEDCVDHPNEQPYRDIDNYFIESYFGGER